MIIYSQAFHKNLLLGVPRVHTTRDSTSTYSHWHHEYLQYTQGSMSTYHQGSMSTYSRGSTSTYGQWLHEYHSQRLYEYLQRVAP